AWCWRVRAWCARSDRAGRRLLRLRHTQAGAVVEDDLPAAVGIAPPGGAARGDRIALGSEDRAAGPGQFAAGPHRHDRRTPGEGRLGLLEKALPVGGDGLASTQRVLAVDEDGVLGEEADEGLEVAIGHGLGEGGFGGGDLALESGDVDLRRRSGGGAGG